jgi:hypothetical protein
MGARLKALLLCAAATAMILAPASAGPADSAPTLPQRAGGSRSCAAPSVHLQQSLYGKGLHAYSMHKASSAGGCCAACLANATGCGAWFSKLPPEDDRGGGAPTGDCLLYAVATAAQLRRGNCPGTSRVTSDCHFAVQLNHFIPALLSYSVAAFLN